MSRQIDITNLLNQGEKNETHRCRYLNETVFLLESMVVTSVVSLFSSSTNENKQLHDEVSLSFFRILLRS